MRTTLRMLASAVALALPLTAQAQTQLIDQSFGGTQATAFTCSDHQTGECFTKGPDQVGTNGLSVILTSGLLTPMMNGSMIGTTYYDLEQNGMWSGYGGTYAATNGNSLLNYGLRFAFDRPMYAVGAWMNYSTLGDAPALIKAFDQNGAMLGQFDLKLLAPIHTEGHFDGQAFRGITSTEGIYMFELAGSYLITRNLFVVRGEQEQRIVIDEDVGGDGPIIIDDTPHDEFPPNEYHPTVVTPEPGTYLLVAAGLAGLGFLKRRRRA